MFRTAARIACLMLALSAMALGQEPKLKWVARIEPVYPQMARIAHIQGEVWMEMELDPQGTIVDLSPLSGHPILVQSASEALKKSKFVCENCTGENAIFSVLYRFKIDDPPPRPEAAASGEPPYEYSNTALKTRSAKCLFLWRCSRR